MLSFGSSVSAMCAMPFIPERFWYHPANNTEAFIAFDEKTKIETLIVKPEFTANTKDFGLVMPVPNKPTVSEGPDTMFLDLDTLTNPFRPIPMMATGVNTLMVKNTAEDVTVVETKNIGTYTATTLQATSTIGLLSWLKNNGYTYTKNDVKNMSYYVAAGNYYFVTLKVNMDKITPPVRKCACGPACDALCIMPDWQYSGELPPISFEFMSSKPMLPLHAMSGPMGKMDFTLYTLSETPYYVPGVEISYADTVEKSDAVWVQKYNAAGKWLVRMNIGFDPKKITTDMFLLAGNDRIKLPAPTNWERTVFQADPELMQKSWGLIQADKNIPIRNINQEWLKDTSRTLRFGNTGNDVLALQNFFNTFWESNIPTTGYFGPKTLSLVKKFQKQYGIEITGKIDTKTKEMIQLIPMK